MAPTSKGQHLLGRNGVVVPHHPIQRRRTLSGKQQTSRESNDDGLPLPHVNHMFRYALVGTAALACYVNTLEASFVFDDTEAVLNNADVLPATSVWNLLHNDFWGTRLTHNGSHKSFRPLTVLTYRWSHMYAGGLHPYAFHIANVILHAAVSVLALPVFEAAFGPEADSSWSFLCALLFAVHPVHTEAVAAVVGRADLLMAGLLLCAFLVYVQATDRGSFGASVGLAVISVAFTALSLLCKEQGITAIGVCAGYDMLVAYRRNGNRRLLLSRQLVLLAGGSSLLLFRWWIMGSCAPEFQKVDNPASFSESFLVRVLTYQHLYVLNCWILLCPLWLCFDWSMGCIPLVETLMDPRIGGIIAFWVVMAGLAFKAAWSQDETQRRGVALGLVLLVVPFLPASNVFFRVGFVVAERILYVPSVGGCLLVTSGLRKLAIAMRNSSLGRNLLMLCMCWLVTLLGFRSVVRSAEWRSESTLFASGLSVCPNNAKVHYNIAKNAADAGDKVLAMAEYQEALRLNPEYNQAMNNLANILKDAGRLEEAEIHLKRAVRIRPDFAAAWMNLGIVLSQQRRFGEAEASYLMALSHRRKSADTFYNLGNLFLEQKRYSEAHNAWREATRLNPKHAIAWNNMVIMMDSIGDTRAEEVAQEALSHLPDEPGIHFHLANVLGKASRFVEAEMHFREAIRLKPASALYHANLGVLFHRWKKYARAEAEYKKALEIDPGLKSAKDNLTLLRKKSKNKM